MRTKFDLQNPDPNEPTIPENPVPEVPKDPYPVTDPVVPDPEPGPGPEPNPFPGPPEPIPEFPPDVDFRAVHL